VRALAPIALCGWTWLAWTAYWLWAARGAAVTKTSEGYASRLQHVLPLVAGLLLILHGTDHHLLARAWHHSLVLAYTGVAMTAAGLAFMVWGRVHLGRNWSGMVTLKEGHRLIRTGPYAIVRHPLYTGILFAAAGSALAAGTGDALVGFAILVPAFLLKIHKEETLLTREFGDEYLRFKRQVPALVPLVY
jgi:protein-S-isoprenylcysteine O-methyltransferase Ste14